MSNLFFQGRGTVYLSELVAGVKGPAKFALCTDQLAIKVATQTWSHINKCGANDVEDARGTNSESAEVTMLLADMQDKVFALGVLGTINAADGSPGTVTNEALPSGIVAGDSYFLGGKTRHRTITALVIVDSASPRTLVADTDYTLDAATGRVTFLTAIGTQPYSASYGYTDPEAVSILTAAQKEYVLDYEFINKQNANKKGSYELFRVRFDPADNLDLQSDKEQSFSLKGSCLADLSRVSTDTILGQFGRRVL